MMLPIPYPGTNNVVVEQYQPWMNEPDWCGEYARDVLPEETP
jgi:hypothetical protein